MYELSIKPDSSREYDVGSFKLVSTTLRATDPIYEDDKPVLIRNCKPGNWQAVTDISDTDCGTRVTTLIVHHRSIRNPYRHAHRLVGEISVGIGRAGFFDNATYSRGDGVFASIFDSEALAVVSPHGVISASGLGDGDYPVTAYANKKGQVIAAVIDFIAPEVDVAA